MAQSITIFEFDTVFDGTDEQTNQKSTHHGTPALVYKWLKEQCLKMDDDSTRWLKLKRVHGAEAIQFTGYVGVLRSPSGLQIEVLPKTGKHSNGDVAGTRQLLIRMLICMRDFKHYKTAEAAIEKVKMPLLEVFIRQFLLEVEAVVRRGLRSDYVTNQDNLFALRGKLLWSQHLKQNIVRRDRFFTEHDEFSPNRPENRLIHSALKRVLKISQSAENQKLARELGFVFNEICESTDITKDFQKVRLDRGMEYYEPALDWAKLLLNNQSPLTGKGKSEAISLMFPMAALFEAYVAKHLRAKLNNGFHLKEQVRSKHMVNHQVNNVDQKWFLLKPDLLVHNGDLKTPTLIIYL
jgi:5-methylcytosine-specific restriction enzyme subunit McrC